jgi:hypothetical protein
MRLDPLDEQERNYVTLSDSSLENWVCSSNVPPVTVRVYLYDIFFTCKEKNIPRPLIHANNIYGQIKLGEPAT